ncbi:muts domain V-domain-containing protein [Biscogniauxia sp. FL1348]|nr:muts domain V-domain-containing protein [Biscogniauxia sp. FL1348]
MPTMSSKHSVPTSSRVSSVPSVSRRPEPSTPLPTGRSTYSTPVSRRTPQGTTAGSSYPPAHPTAANSGRSSRPSSRSATQPYPSSPQLPSHPRRQRLSLRPPSQRASSVISDGHPEDDDPEHDDEVSQEDADALNEIIMAIDMRDGNLGCAYYTALDEALFLLEDVAMAEIDLVETILLHARPTTVLISARASESLADCLARGAQGIDGNQGDLQGAYVLRNLNSSDFRYETARDKLLGLDLGMDSRPSMLYTSVVDQDMAETDDCDAPEGSRQGRLMQLGTSINIESRVTIGCAGAVLNDIQRRRTAQYLPNDPDASVAFRIRSVEMFALFDSMFVNADTLISLQILQSEYHPNKHQRGPTNAASGSKESLSLYGLFQHLTSTQQGRTRLRQVFLRPSTNINLIRERQQTISFLLRHDNTEALVNMNKDLKKIKNMKYTLGLLRKGVDHPGKRVSVANNVWATLQKFAHYSLKIRECLRSLQGAEKVAVLRKVVAIVEPLQICRVGELISQAIDFEQSVERGRTAVKHGIDDNLDELKRRYDGMEHFLSSVTVKLRSDIPEWARKYVQNCIFFPQLGYLTVVSLNPETGKGDYDGEGLNDVWERMFAAEGLVYYKNRQMRELDAQFGDAYCMIIDREVEIIHELAVKIMEREDVILATSEVLGELDSLLALAIGCGKYNWVSPKMTNENTIQIEGGRHPLQELVVPSFIPNDCYVAGGPGDHGEATPSESSLDITQDSVEYPNTLVLTGPNHSGKSVYLKQVALIVYLAHIGCFVPAQRACIGITDRILTRIATRESVARNESAFAIDLRQVAFAMNFATRRSLVLVDEFGKGTDNLDGVGLMAALLDHFTSLGPERPKVLAATHFHEIFEGRFLEKRETLAFAHMDIHIDYDAPTLEDQVIYLYQLVPGRSISSFGTRCAAMNGIDQAIVARAESLTLALARNEDLEVVCSKLSDAETQKLEDAEAVARAFLEEDIAAPPSKSESAGWYLRTLERVLSAGESTYV